MDQPRRTADAIRWVEQQLGQADLYFGHGTDNALDEAAWLVGAALGISPHELEAHLDDELTSVQLITLHNLLDSRIGTRKPLAYLLKEAWFAGLKFYVDERVIVPRSLTAEFITEQFQPWIDPARVRCVLDLCTGSGCMAIALAVAFPEARVEAVDISEDALVVARINVENHNLHARVRLLRSDLFRSLSSKRYDLIVTNPPYVGHGEMETLPPEYGHEPALALTSGEDGLEAVTRILAEAASHLNPGGILVAEVGNSAELLQKKFASVPFTWLTTSTGDESVFLLAVEQLQQHHAAFVRAAN